MVRLSLPGLGVEGFLPHGLKGLSHQFQQLVLLEGDQWGAIHLPALIRWMGRGGLHPTDPNRMWETMLFLVEYDVKIY